MLPDNHISHTMKKVSLQMIADSLGVSKCTVSLVLSGKSRDKRVSEELSRKIIAKAKELNYRPNELARGLRTGRTQTLGVIVADISNEFVKDIKSSQEIVLFASVGKTNSKLYKQIKMMLSEMNKQIAQEVLI